MTPFGPLAPTRDLISFAVCHLPTDEDDGTYWEVVYAVQTRGVFDAATALLTSPCATERALGASIHSQLGCGQDEPFRTESLRLLETEEDGQVIRTARHRSGRCPRASGGRSRTRPARGWTGSLWRSLTRPRLRNRG